MQESDPHNTIYINGRFLTQRLGGVQRFALEILKALDIELSEGRGGLGNRTWVLLVPPSTEPPLALRRITTKAVGIGNGHFWDQLVLPRAAKGGVLVSLANSAPIIHPRNAVIIHDAAVFRTPKNFSLTYVILHRFLGVLLSRRSYIGTVSEFSKQELSQILRTDSSKIFIVSNSCEHLRNVVPDDSILARLNLVANAYFLFVGKSSPNKNLNVAMAAFAQLNTLGLRFVIVGAADSHVFRSGFEQAPPGVIIAGHLSDSELVSLYQGATALLFPSVYEGFGIPPLEAMVIGCPVLASRIPAVVEVCGDAALYFDPLDVDSLINAMSSVCKRPALRDRLIEQGIARSALFSWRRSARQLTDAIADIA